MTIRKFMSELEPEVNAHILRAIESLVCRFPYVMPEGWRCLIEFQRYDDKTPYYGLDVKSDKGDAPYATFKMNMLRHFEYLPATGGNTPADIVNLIEEELKTNIIPDEIADPIISRLTKIDRLSQLDSAYWEQLANYAITHWYGAIRVPYNILVTDIDAEDGNQNIRSTHGQIRIAFSGAKEHEDTFIAFHLLANIQSVLNKYWTVDQISYDLSALKQDPHLNFWIDLLDIHKA